MMRHKEIRRIQSETPCETAQEEPVSSMKHKASASNRFNRARTASMNTATPRPQGYSGRAEDPIHAPTGKGKRAGTLTAAK